MVCESHMRERFRHRRAASGEGKQSAIVLYVPRDRGDASV